MTVKGITDGADVVARIGLEQSLSDQDIDFCFAQLDHDTTQPCSSPLTVRAHALSRGGAGDRRARGPATHLGML